jgi:hypothetical protein
VRVLLRSSPKPHRCSSAEQLDAIRALEAQLSAEDAEVKKKSDAKNQLETFIFDIRRESSENTVGVDDEDTMDRYGLPIIAGSLMCCAARSSPFVALYHRGNNLLLARVGAHTFSFSFLAPSLAVFVLLARFYLQCLFISS